MKIITIEEHYMSEKVNDRFMELNQPKDEVQAKDDMDFCMKAFAPDHILWAQDYPYGLNEANYDTKASLVKTFLEELDLDEETKENFAHRNAEKLFRL